jgi:hypothetical protein
MTDIDRKIAFEIIEAQASSDAGKRLDRLDGHKLRYAKHMRYAYKPMAIKRAIDTIRSTKNSMFKYYVVEADDQNGYPSIIAYFMFKHDGARYQISFHSPMNTADILLPYVGSGTKMRWDKKSSIATAQLLNSML